MKIIVLQNMTHSLYSHSQTPRYTVPKQTATMTSTATTLIESCRIPPPPGTVAEQSLPLTFLDLIWLHFHPIRRLLFYEIPYSNLDFSNTLLPKLKRSLSLTLKHYFPLAGKLIHSTSRKPVIRYLPGDSVPMTVFESTNDFDTLVGNRARDADAFYDYIPHLPPITEDESSNEKLLQVLALQVTLFPGKGLCVGIVNHHAIGDASSIVGFVRAWAETCKLGGEKEVAEYLTLDRSLVKDPLGLESIYWEQKKNIPLALPGFPLPTKRVRAKYALSRSQIEKLKDSVDGCIHTSAFVVTTAYVWSCLAKSCVRFGKEVDCGHEVELLLFPVDIRSRLDPPLPGSYFGNCLGYGLGKVGRAELVGAGGFWAAAKAIGEEIRNRVNHKEKFMEGDENRVSIIKSVLQKGVLGVSGSTRVDLYGADFGWGKARNIETLSIDGEEYAMSLCKSRDCEGGLEVGLSLPKLKMDAFDALFRHGLNGF